MSSSDQTKRPGGRSERVARSIFAATTELLVARGIDALSFQEVAERAGVGRATVYRRWPNMAALVADAVRATAAERIVVADTGSLRGDLEQVLRQIAAFISTPVGKAALVAALSLPAAADREGALWSERWKQVVPLFDRAMARGEITAGCDTEELFAQLSGALYFRLLVMRGPVDEAWIARILDQFREIRPR